MPTAIKRLICFLIFEDVGFVKGKKKFEYPAMVQKGIMLHRAIDEFTDFHPVTARAKQYFRPVYRLYSAVFTDVVYDHFLAKDVLCFKNTDVLAEFSTHTYQLLSDYQHIFPANFAGMFPYMQKHNWLYNYQYRQGIRNSFDGLARRAKYFSESGSAFAIFETHYMELKECYEEFFPALKEFSYNHLQLLLKE